MLVIYLFLVILILASICVLYLVVIVVILFVFFIFCYFKVMGGKVLKVFVILLIKEIRIFWDFEVVIVF